MIKTSNYVDSNVVQWRKKKKEEKTRQNDISEDQQPHSYRNYGY
jgi:hypothetical protein